MHLCHSISDVQSALQPYRMSGSLIGLVPTMGNLHQGHLSLVELAREHSDVVVVSVFVNPTQFGAGEDFDNYSRTLDADIALLKDKVDIVFAPSVAHMYPTYPPNVQIHSGVLGSILCAKSRPTHFDGVGLVVSKLFNIVRPNVAIFGKKDYQQLAIIRQLVHELDFDIKIIGGQIVRAPDGLALSSRNGYLSASERQTAPKLHALLTQMAEQLPEQRTQLPELMSLYHQNLTQAGFVVDYLEVLNDSLDMPTPSDRHLVILTACYLGKTRLLDNIEVLL